MMERAAISSLNRNFRNFRNFRSFRRIAPEKVVELRGQHRGSQAAAAGDLEGGATHDVRGRLGDVRCPVLLLLGAEDFWVPVAIVEATARKIPRAELEVLDGVGHSPMFEAPERTLDITMRFLAKHGLAPRA